MLLVYVFIYGF